VFAKRLDFLSIGTNDLIQYTLAIDRTDEQVAHLYDPLHPAVLHLLSLIISNSNKYGIPISVCGEMAGELAYTRLLLGLGLRQFSMYSAQVPSIKQRVLSTNVPDIATLTQKILRADDPLKIRELLDTLNPPPHGDSNMSFLSEELWCVIFSRPIRTRHSIKNARLDTSKVRLSAFFMGVRITLGICNGRP